MKVSTGTGACFMAVCRGKLSEGIDFSGNNKFKKLFNIFCKIGLLFRAFSDLFCLGDFGLGVVFKTIKAATTNLFKVSSTNFGTQNNKF